eukprot:CAMPEP_0174750112 /NCGR_PEP_ID=MMETSP1094-20130205/97054_1 /TAXON_ID=156173 /ORGANISM="Chrysochromulina brevifilum, Strain UTEX LB 985" /LENGTH=73 /DNA_ID=CAMNT_0015955413 /DNA_START=45 /DNA_END=262 /DNA_ORIENTATION=+
MTIATNSRRCHVTPTALSQPNANFITPPLKSSLMPSITQSLSIDLLINIEAASAAGHQVSRWPREWPRGDHPG